MQCFFYTCIVCIWYMAQKKVPVSPNGVAYKLCCPCIIIILKLFCYFFSFCSNSDTWRQDSIVLYCNGAHVHVFLLLTPKCMLILYSIKCVCSVLMWFFVWLSRLARNTSFSLELRGVRPLHSRVAGKRWKRKGCCCVLGDRGVMDLQRKTSETFQLLGAEDLPEDWVARCWEENFCESSPLPSQVGFERAS